MQKDMHFAGTYIAARAAGFGHAEADTIANSAQYVDDATKGGFIRFNNGALFQRTASCHTMATPENLSDLQNHLAWMPFHFLPGNDGANYADRLICRENSQIAKDMVESCIADRDLPQGLHRLGITAHVLADTFAHQGFAGMIHPVNTVTELFSEDPVLHRSITTQIQTLWGEAIHRGAPMLGHGLAHTYPDLPWLDWSYTDGQMRKVARNNLDIFLRAFEAICRMFQCYRGVEASGLPAATTDILRRHLLDIRLEDGQKRCDAWTTLLQQDDVFGWGAPRLEYRADGWRQAALGMAGEFADIASFDEIVPIPYPDDFLASDWKLFHDAAKDHRHQVMQRILPRYELCGA